MIPQEGKYPSDFRRSAAAAPRLPRPTLVCHPGGRAGDIQVLGPPAVGAPVVVMVISALAGVRPGTAGQRQEGGFPRQPAAILARNRGIACAGARLDRNGVPAAFRRLDVLACHAVPRLQGAMLANLPPKGTGGLSGPQQLPGEVDEFGPIGPVARAAPVEDPLELG